VQHCPPRKTGNDTHLCAQDMGCKGQSQDRATLSSRHGRKQQETASHWRLTEPQSLGELLRPPVIHEPQIDLERKYPPSSHSGLWEWDSRTWEEGQRTEKRTDAKRLRL
jgi:hypothetical protein